MVTIADAGLPIPSQSQRIDLALKEGVPGFIETMQVVLQELQVEKAIVAEEMKSISPDIYKELQGILGELTIEFIPHNEFKEMTGMTKAVIRTGEFTPYANVILVAGVIF
jgi:D-ribose pyranase